MAEVVDITVENKLIKEKRSIHVYHHAARSTHIISPNNTIIVPLGTVGEDDYLYISVVKGPGNLCEDSFINVPSWADFQFFFLRDVSLSHPGDRIVLKIPPGPPTCELKVMRPSHLTLLGPLSGNHNRNHDYVTIGDTI